MVTLPIKRADLDTLTLDEKWDVMAVEAARAHYHRGGFDWHLMIHPFHRESQIYGQCTEEWWNDHLSRELIAYGLVED